MSAELPYGRAAELLQMLLPEMGGLTAMTNRNRTLAVGKEIERELCDEVNHPRESPEPAQHLTVGIDGAFVKADAVRSVSDDNSRSSQGESKDSVGAAKCLRSSAISTDVPSRKFRRFCGNVGTLQETEHHVR